MANVKAQHMEPIFTRGEVAKILNCTPLTIANRETKGKYPEPARDLNNYRVYSLSDVLNLQGITYGTMDPHPILSVLYDRGYKDVKSIKYLGQLMDKALARRSGSQSGD